MSDLFNKLVDITKAYVKNLKPEDFTVADKVIVTLSRTNDPQTSKDAAKKMVESGELNRQEQWIYETIMEYVTVYREEDFTTKDIAHCIPFLSIPDYPYHKAYDICKKRFSGLRNKGKIEVVVEKVDISRYTFIYKDKRRDGCRVWRKK